MEPFLEPLLPESCDPSALAADWATACEAASHVVADEGLSEDEAGEVLCNCEFSLAYGGGGWGQPLREPGGGCCV